MFSLKKRLEAATHISCAVFWGGIDCWKSGVLQNGSFAADGSEEEFGAMYEDKRNLSKNLPERISCSALCCTPSGSLI